MSLKPSDRPKQAPSIIEAVTRGFDPLIEPGNTVTMHQLAQGVLTSLAEAGYVVVPRVPNKAMVDAAPEWGKVDFYPSDVWRAMVKAAE
jgi:hypothetical protein